MNVTSKRSKIYWKVIGIPFSSLLLSLLLLWLPATVQAIQTISVLHETPLITIQSTPTVDPTITALGKQKLENDTNWWWNNGVTLITSLVTTFSLLGGGLFALVRWFGDRQDEREKRSEERFQAIVEGLGNTSQAAQVGAAITLRTFLRPGYEQFYRQVFDLAVAHLRLRNVDPDRAEPLDSLSQALITIFKESFPLVRQQFEDTENRQQFDAARVQLDHAYLFGAVLQSVWMPRAYLRSANLRRADLSEASLNGADLSEANLTKTDLDEADLSEANLAKTDLSKADLSGADFQNVKTWMETKLLNVKGLTPNQLAEFQAKGAIIEEKNKKTM